MDTPLTKYFPAWIVRALLKEYGIRSMEHLVSLLHQPQVLESIAEHIGTNKESFTAIIENASEKVIIPERSKRDYPLGVAI